MTALDLSDGTPAIVATHTNYDGAGVHIHDPLGVGQEVTTTAWAYVTSRSLHVLDACPVELRAWLLDVWMQVQAGTPPAPTHRYETRYGQLRLQPIAAKSHDTGCSN